MFKKERERGQGIVEAALVLPIVTMLSFLIIQFGWVVYTGSCLSYATAHAQYVITVEDVDSGDDINEVVRTRMIEAAPVLQSGTLTVTNAHARVLPTVIETRILSDADFDNYLIGTANEMTTRVQVDAQIEYQPVMLFGISSPVKYLREIESSRIINETFELA